MTALPTATYDSHGCRTMFLIVNSDIFKHIHILFSHIVAYLEPRVSLWYSEPCHIQNPGIFRTQDVFRTLSRHILEYLKHCLTLTYWEHCDIQSISIFRILTYLQPRHIENPIYIDTFRHIQLYSIMIVTITFLNEI